MHDKRMRLGAFLTATGQHVAAWRHPGVLADMGTNLAAYIDVAKTAERGKFDMMFLADNAGVWQRDIDSRGHSSRAAYFEPITLLSALASHTTRLGLVATMTASFTEPYNVARLYASLDHLSGGRAGWNLVTSANGAEALNFGYDEHMQHAERYDRAREFAQVVLGLWDSWADDAFLLDKESGRYFDPDRLHVLKHIGQHFKVRGPLNVPRSPQGRPVLVQAGSSEAGIDLAAETAEVVFTAQALMSEARTFYQTVKQRAAAFGRDPETIKIMPGLSPVVGRTRSDAHDKFDELQQMIQPEIGLPFVSAMVGGFDLSSYDPDGPLPELPETNLGKGRQRLVIDTAIRENLTIRQLWMRVAGARGHQIVIGTAQDVADRMEEWFTGGAADGFNIMPQTLPGALNDFVELVIPELQRRGLFRCEYDGRTLRENLGLPRPPNQYFPQVCVT